MVEVFVNPDLLQNDEVVLRRRSEDICYSLQSSEEVGVSLDMKKGQRGKGGREGAKELTRILSCLNLETGLSALQREKEVSLGHER